MPYIAGESLRARLRRETQLPLDEALRLTREVAGALGHAHHRGLVHRDIKPENVLLSEGIALVADFGIARTLAGARVRAPAASMSGLAAGPAPVADPATAATQIGASDTAVDEAADTVPIAVPSGASPSAMSSVLSRSSLASSQMTEVGTAI